jgi:hypothetical protein
VGIESAEPVLSRRISQPTQRTLLEKTKIKLDEMQAMSRPKVSMKILHGFDCPGPMVFPRSFAYES